MNLVKTLDEVFSQWVRLNAADEDGICTCVTSGDRIYWKSIDSGHFVRRGNMSTRWLEENVHPQSFTENRLKHGNLTEYRKWMIDTYGEEKVAQIENLGRSEVKFTQSELKDKIAYYRAKVRELKKIKNCQRLF